ncbi:hypothetical protein JOD67_003305 [Tenggerimyces flavus]|nr:hypothetical protein [Tenggerimyces flavus]
MRMNLENCSKATPGGANWVSGHDPLARLWREQATGCHNRP